MKQPEFVVVVRGDPAPQGSKEIQRGKGGKPFLVESSKRVDPWRKAIVAACLTEDGKPRMTFTGPVAVGIAFMFRQAKSNEDDYPTGQNIGDIDKLIRAVYDALKMAGVIEDDRYVVDVLPTTKRWSPSASGARITVRSVPAPNPFRSTAGSVMDLRAAERMGLDESVTFEAVTTGAPVCFCQGPCECKYYA